MDGSHYYLLNRMGRLSVSLMMKHWSCCEYQQVGPQCWVPSSFLFRSGSSFWTYFDHCPWCWSQQHTGGGSARDFSQAPFSLLTEVMKLWTQPTAAVFLCLFILLFLSPTPSLQPNSFVVNFYFEMCLSEVQHLLEATHLYVTPTVQYIL